MINNKCILALLCTSFVACQAMEPDFGKYLSGSSGQREAARPVVVEQVSVVETAPEQPVVVEATPVVSPEVAANTAQSGLWHGVCGLVRGNFLYQAADKHRAYALLAAFALGNGAVCLFAAWKLYKQRKAHRQLLAQFEEIRRQNGFAQ